MKKEKTPTRNDMITELISLEALLAQSKYLVTERMLYVIHRIGHFLQGRLLREIHGDDSYLKETDERWDVQTTGLPGADEFADIINKHGGTWALAYFCNVPTVELIECMYTRLIHEIVAIDTYGERKDQDPEYVAGYLGFLKQCFVKVADVSHMHALRAYAIYSGEEVV